VRAGRIAIVALGAAWLAGAEAASALVGCETTGGRLKLRPEACKPGKERVAFDTGGDPTGVWRWTSGPPLAGTPDTFTEYLVLAQDGSGRVHRRQRSAGTLDCRPLSYARSLSATLTLDAHGAEGAELWRGRLNGPDALELADATGATRFERASAVDAAFECVELAETRRFSGLPAPSYFTGLAFDGTLLWYTSVDGVLVQPVDPGTGIAGTALDLGATFNEVHAAQGGDFWTHCACGGSPENWRVTAAGALVDEVEPGPGLGGELSIGAIARDEIGAVLWLYGYSYEDAVRRLLQVRSDPEPDELAASLEVSFYVHALTWDGAALWGLQDRKLYRIDPLTGIATATYELPDASVAWQALAAANGELFVIGRSGVEGVLVSVAP
jgi:hypothetical protein